MLIIGCDSTVSFAECLARALASVFIRLETHHLSPQEQNHLCIPRPSAASRYSPV